MKFQVRDELGEVYNTITEPAAIVDLDAKILLKIGNFEDMENYCEFMKTKYIEGGFPGEAECLAVLRLPSNQEEIDKILQSTSYIKKYIQ